jgi:hypothetical protein
MAFIGGDTDKIKLTLTQFGVETLMKRGLNKKTIVFYQVQDQDVNYLTDEPPNLMADINGSKKTIVPNSVKFRYNLTNKT